jgi:hypothetical protein
MIEHMEKTSKGELRCLISWRVREDGFTPLSSWYLNDEVKVIDPELLIDYYESRLVFPKTKTNGSN